MTAKMPPVPPQNRSPKGPGDLDHTNDQATLSEPPKKAGKTGQSGNTRVNTKNQGMQQDR